MVEKVGEILMVRGGIAEEKLVDSFQRYFLLFKSYFRLSKRIH